ncbi:restriction endonuclease subunit S [Chryseobacterium arthrosphaerae]|uniref:restriction endonuclease subunit S n=1 Tax=Chryseobacterium arthrosphaerae TaxID=651561 RepID=UPI003D347B8A
MNKCKLRDISVLITKGTTPTTVGGEFSNEGIKFIKSESITGSKFLDKSLFSFISEDIDLKLKRSRIQKNDLLFSIAGAYLGKIAIATEEDTPANTNQAVAIVRVDSKKADVNYLYYFFSQKNINEYINKLSSQSSQPNLNLELLGNLEFQNRNLVEQQKISSVLSALDDKIELNNKINTELELMAKTLYNYWFVQFDFPDEEGKPYKSSGGKMAYNEVLKREIPQGWEVKRLEEIENNIITGKTPSTLVKDNFGGDIPFVTIDDIRKQLFIINSDRKLSEKGAGTQKSKFLEIGDICVSCIGTVGVIGIVGKKCQTNQQINTISKVKDYNRYFLLNALKKYFEFNVAAKQGAVLSNMNKGEFSDIPILDCPKEIKTKFLKIVMPFYDKLNLNLQQNQELASLRDWLLPMLMNGQVKVEK